MANTDFDRLVAEFARNVAEQTAAIQRGDARTGNKHAKRYINAFRKLRAAGDPGREALARLFGHESPDVRAMAAAFLLRYRTEEAKALLRQISSQGPSLVAFEAGEALKRWEEGTCALDPDDAGPGE